MSDKETKRIEEDGNTFYESLDGKRYKTRSGAWKRNQKLKKTKEVVEEPLNEVPKEPVATEEAPDFEGPEWAQFDMGDLPEGVQVIPQALKKVRRLGVKAGKKMSKAEMELEAQTNESILKMGYRTGDYLMTRYGRAMLVDEEFQVAHTEEDYTWISSITYAFLHDRGISIAAVIGPGTLAGVCNAYWFGKPMYEINKKAKISPLRSAGKKIGGLRKFFRLPKFLRKKKKPPEPKGSQFGDDWTTDTGFEP